MYLIPIIVRIGPNGEQVVFTEIHFKRATKVNKLIASVASLATLLNFNNDIDSN